MSGFGGFGQQQQQPNNVFGSVFGSQPPASAVPTNPTGFGSSPSLNTGFGGGFGTAAPPSTFGSNSFGTSNAQFGSNTNAAFGNASTFGSAPAPSSSGFGGGTSAPTSGFGGGFEATPSSSGRFGSGTTSGFNSGFNTGSSGFGNSNANSSFAPASTFGNAPGGGFSSPGIANSPAAPLAFGSSSTVAFGASPSVSNTAAPASTGFGFGSSSNKSGESSNSAWGASTTTSNSGWGAAAPSSSGFGGFGSADKDGGGTGWGAQINTHGNSSQTGFGFGSSSQSETKNSTSFGFRSAQSEGSSPFGKTAWSQSAGTPFGSQNQQRPNDDDMGDGDEFPAPSSPFGRIPRKERKTEPKEGLTSHLSSDAPLAASRGEESGDDHLAALRAKIQEKKNKLLKMKKNNQTNEAGGINSEATEGGEAVPPSSSFNSELAAKNARRFATAGSSQGQPLAKLLPADLKGRAEEAQSSSSDVQDYGQGDNDNYEDDNEADDFQRNLSSAKSLIGICKSMCPDEELLRREREGDIQLLEITDPGGLHPKDWTLRDTAVKRFRRSAADFKLDIPELVRPPEVLERVCGYLEEWVMERDRQGPDKRFTQQPSIVPPPLDVYQFIWDRTRMIRKDFILQNYIGTGGKCDARAVRCHERIARWHAMCEHQLSHIQEFVTHQSQQNVAELGQTMKTLNLYYDDALGRALTEEAGENSEKYAQGCASDVVMGKSPVDFDGSDLANNTTSEDVSKRIIGVNGMKSSTRGTAEPEMRGLYILLTMNNEGGMEVLKYSGRLCTHRPDIFYSRPVQLALSIFQARKDHNYAKFFHLLRSTSTPYLFSCIMFKYVEQMRKTALMIMSKTYGAKHKTTGESFYDEYPLERLVNLLCFEDVEEAREACIHYGIKLEGDVIRWRSSKFAEKKDPVKGTVLTLKPKKMLRTIECKLYGATRLSVCRGGVSGDGATAGNEFTSKEEEQAAMVAAECAKKEAIEREEAQKTKLLELMQKQRAEEALRKEEAEKKEMERKRLEAIVEEKKRAQQAERKKELEDKKRLEQIRQQELRLKQEREEVILREAREREAAIKRAEEEKRERARLELLEKQRKEEELKRRLAAEAENKRRMEEEARRKADEEEKRRIAYEVEQKRLAEQERLRKQREKEEKIWQAKVDGAKKILIWSLWMKQVRRQHRLSSPARSLDSIDPTITCCPHLSYNQAQSLAYKKPPVLNQHDKELENRLYRLATASKETINLSQIAADTLTSLAPPPFLSSHFCLAQPTILFKLSVVFPQPTPGNENLIKSLLTWVDSHLRLNTVTHAVSGNQARSIHIQATSTIGNNDSNFCGDCDAALFLLPTSVTTNGQSEFSPEVLDSLPDDVSRLILLIEDAESCTNHFNAVIDNVLGPDNESAGSCQTRNGVVASSNDEVESALRVCCETLVRTSLQTASNQPIVRVSLSKLSCLCLRCMLYNMDANGTHLLYSQPEDAFLALCELSKSTIRSMVNQLSNAADEIECQTMSLWPAKEFIDERSNSVANYFEGVDYLPSDWHFSLHDTLSLEVKVFGSLHFLFAPESFESFVEALARSLPSYQQESLINMLDGGNFIGCYAKVISLVISGKINLDHKEMPTIYLPVRMMDQVIERSGQCEPPVAPDMKELADVPFFLYNAIPDSYEVEECAAEESPGEVEHIQFESSPVVTPQLHKRKPSDGVLAQSVTTSRTKRFRIGLSDKVQSKEEESSREFTSYLEAMLL